MDDESLARAALDAMPAAEPPDGFAERVARAATPAARPRMTRWLLAGAAAAAAIVVGLLMLPPSADGHAEPSARETFRLGSRGVAVAEGGASLSWSVERSGSARVQQQRGDVFYRVEPGGAFVLTAQGVDVTVRGTCFRVEETMNTTGKMGLSAAVGALASAVVVTVYEGRVQVHSGTGTSEVSAGERVEVLAGQPPRPLASDPRASVQAAAGAAGVAGAAALEVAALQTRVRALEQERDALKGRAAQPPAAATDVPGSPPPQYKTRDFTPDERTAMARACEVRFDAPELGDEKWKMSAKLAQAQNLSPDQQAQVAAAVNQLRAGNIASLRALYVEVSGDRAGADNISPSNLGSEILQKSRLHDDASARAKISAELAGLAPPPTDLSQGTVAERYYRLMGQLGDSVQNALTPIVGAAQAPALRDAIDTSHSSSNGCEEPGDP